MISKILVYTQRASCLIYWWPVVWCKVNLIFFTHKPKDSITHYILQLERCTLTVFGLGWNRYINDPFVFTLYKPWHSKAGVTFMSVIFRWVFSMFHKERLDNYFSCVCRCFKCPYPSGMPIAVGIACGSAIKQLSSQAPSTFACLHSIPLPTKDVNKRKVTLIISDKTKCFDPIMALPSGFILHYKFSWPPSAP